MREGSIFELIDSIDNFKDLSREILDSIDAFIFIFDMDTALPIWINKYFERKLNYTNNDLKQFTPADFMNLFHPRSLERFTKRVQNYDSEREGTKTVYQLRSKEGKWVYMLLSSRVYERTVDGRIKLLLGYATEISRDELDANLRQIDEIEQKRPNESLINCLSRRELDVIRFIAKGFTDKEIAEKLHISIHTTKTHRKRIISKLGLRNSAVLIKFAVENGLV